MNSKEYLEYYNKVALLYPHLDNFSENGPHWHRTSFYLRYITAGSKVLDCGCNNGGLTKYLTETIGCEVYAFDIAALSTHNTRENAKAAFCTTCSVNNLPFKDNSFDVIIAGELLEHVLDVEEVVKECLRVLKYNRYFLITTPIVDNGDNEEHIRYLGYTELTNLLPKIYIERTKFSWLGCYKKQEEEYIMSTKVYDCFMFFNEFDLLEIRLNTLDTVVDKFVLVEADHTHSGKKKPLYFDEVKDQERFAKFNSKIIHIIENVFPEGKDSWELENAQRNAIIKGLDTASPNDIIIISDSDEIVNPTIFPLDYINGPYKLQQSFYYYYFNCKVDHDGSTAIVCRMQNILDAPNIQTLRELEGSIPVISKAGWHFSYFGGVDNIVEKIEALAHTENDKVEIKNKSKIEEHIQNGEDLFGRPVNCFILDLFSLENEIPSSISVKAPPYVLDNLERFSKYILKPSISRQSLKILKDKKGLVGAEVGVNLGQNALNMLQTLDIKKLYLIDPYTEYLEWNYTEEVNTARKEMAHRRLEQYKDKIVWIERRASNAIDYVDEELDFVYIDGCHAYKSVKEDIYLYSDKIKNDGLLAGHDYDDNSSGVVKAVNEIFRGKENITGRSLDGLARDWWIIKKDENDIVVEFIPTILESDVVMGTFTHRTTYLDSLVTSTKRFLSQIPFIIKVNNGPINKNMELLRQDFLNTNKRFWVFLDDDIKFLERDTIDLAVKNLLRFKFGLIGAYSTYDPNYIVGSKKLECKEVGWIPGYFMMLDSKYLSDITPDLNLPDACTSIDTSFCMSVRMRGYKIGVSPSVVYHRWKPLVACKQDVIDKTNTYLDKKWKGFYHEIITSTEVIV